MFEYTRKQTKKADYYDDQQDTLERVKTLKWLRIYRKKG